MTDKEKDFLHGLAISAACAALPVRKKLPIAYLYNGVRLPALPEWDRERYPYAYMWLMENTVAGVTIWKYRVLYCLSVPAYQADSYLQYNGGLPYNAIEYRIDEKAGEDNWSEYKIHDNVTSLSSVIGSSNKWANYDVMTAQGNRHLAASEPVPVYE